MKKFSMPFFILAMLGLTAQASATLRYDIIDSGDGLELGDDGVVGFIQFATDGLITSTGNVMDFEYTKEDGTRYTESDIVSIRVLVDDENSMLCWLAADDEDVCANLFDIASDGYGLLLTDETIEGNFAFGQGTPTANFATTFPTDTLNLDRFVHFSPVPVDGDGDGLSYADEIALGTDPDVADTDGDGIPDGSDPDIIATAITALPLDPSVFANSGDPAGHRNAMLNRLINIQSDIASGDIEEALRALRNLRARVDGCGASPDRNDWITDCAAQLEIRRLIDLLVTNLES